jgi:hypothetical protein
MQIDLTYIPVEDRMQLSLRDHSDWLITRSLLIKIVAAWIEKIEAIDLPNIGVPMGQRDVMQEHSLSLEFDGPTNTAKPNEITANADLLIEVTLTVDALSTLLVLKSPSKETNLTLTRKESHVVLEMLAQKARVAGWLDPVNWPHWLGVQ